MDLEEGEIVISDESSDNEEPISVSRPTSLHFKSVKSWNEEVRHTKKKRYSDLRDSHLNHDKRCVTKRKGSNKYKPTNTGRQRNKTGNPEGNRIIVKKNKSGMPLQTPIMYNKHSVLATSNRKTRKHKRKSRRGGKNASDINEQQNLNNRASEKRLFQNAFFNSRSHSTLPVSEGRHTSSLMEKLITSGLAKDLPSVSSDRQLELDSSITNLEFNMFKNTPQSADTASSITKKEKISSNYSHVSIEDAYFWNDSEEDDSEIEVIIPPKKIPPLVTLDSDGDEVNAANVEPVFFQDLSTSQVDCKNTILPNLNKSDNLESNNDTTQNTSYVCDDENSKCSILKSNIAISPSFSDSSSVKYLNSEEDIEPYSPSSPSSFNSEEINNSALFSNRQMNADSAENPCEKLVSNDETESSNNSVEIIKSIPNSIFQTTQIPYQDIDPPVEHNYSKDQEQENNACNKQNISKETVVVHNLQLLLSPNHQVNNDILSDCSQKTNDDDKSSPLSSFHNNGHDTKQIQLENCTNPDTFDECSIKDSLADKLPNYVGSSEHYIPVTDFILQRENVEKQITYELVSKSPFNLISDQCNKYISSEEFKEQVDSSKSSNCGSEQNNKCLKDESETKLDTDEVVLHTKTYLENSCTAPKDVNTCEDENQCFNQEGNVSTVVSDSKQLSSAHSAKPLNTDVLKCDDENDDDAYVSQLRLIALSTKGKTNQNPIENRDKLNSCENIAELNSADDDDDDDCGNEELELRVAALKSAVIKKHEKRRKRGLVVKKRKRASSDDFPICSSVLESCDEQCLPSENTTSLPERAIDSPLSTDGITDSLQGEEDMEIASDTGGDIIQDGNLQGKPHFENQQCKSWESSNPNDILKSLPQVSSIVDSESVLTNYSFLLQPMPVRVDSNFTTGCTQPFMHILAPPLPPPNLMFPLLPPPPPPPLPPIMDDVDVPLQLNQSQYNDSNERNDQSSTHTEKSQYEDIAGDQFCSDIKMGNNDHNKKECGINDTIALSGTKHEVHEVLQTKSDSCTKLCAMTNVKMQKLNFRRDRLRPNLKTIPVLMNVKKNKLTKKMLRKMQKQKLKKKTNEFKQEPRLLCITNTPNIRRSKSKVNLSVKLSEKCPISHYSANFLAEENTKQPPSQNQSTLLPHKALSVFDDLEVVNDSKEPLCDNRIYINNISNLPRHTPPVEEDEMDLSEMIILDEVGMSPEYKPKYENPLMKSLKNDDEDENTLRAHALTTLLTKTVPTKSMSSSNSSQCNIFTDKPIEIKDNYKLIRTEYTSIKTHSETQKRDLENISVTRRMDINDPSKYRLTRVMKKEPTRSVIRGRESLKVIVPSESPPPMLSPPLVDRLVINVGQDSDSDEDSEWLRKVRFETSEQSPEIDSELERKIDLLLLSARQATESTRSTSTSNKAEVVTKTNQLNNKEKNDLDLSETPLRLLPKEKQEEYYRLKKIIEEKERQIQKRLKTGEQGEKESANHQTKPVSAKISQRGQAPQREHLTAETTSGSPKRTVSSDESSSEAKQDIQIYSEGALNGNTTNPDYYDHLYDFAEDICLENSDSENRPSEDTDTASTTVQSDNQAHDTCHQSTYSSVSGTKLEESNTEMNTEFHEVKPLNDKNEVNENSQSLLTGSEDLIQLQQDSSDLKHANENKIQTEESICPWNKPSLDEEVLTANQALLLNERFVLIEELSMMSESLSKLEREQVCVNKEVMKINQLRKALLAAEQRLLTQTETTQRLEQALYEAHKSVYSRHTRIEELGVSCRELGTRLRGPQYLTLAFGNELMVSKIQQVNEQITNVRIKKEMIKALMENPNTHRKKLETYCAQRKNELENKSEEIKNTRLQEPNIFYIAPLPVDLIISRLPEHCASSQSSTISSHVESTSSNQPSGSSSINPQRVGSSLQFLDVPLELHTLPSNLQSSNLTVSSIESSENDKPPDVTSYQMTENVLEGPESLSSPCSPTSPNPASQQQFLSLEKASELEPQLSSATENFKIDKEQDKNQIHKSKSFDIPILEKRGISEVCGSSDYSSINKRPHQTAMDIEVSDTNVMESENNTTFCRDLQNSNTNISVSKYKLTNKSKIKPTKSFLKYNSVLQYKQPIKIIPSSEVTGDILCRYEICGKCQDQHCKYKHFSPRS